jgi:hypothetical protein
MKKLLYPAMWAIMALTILSTTQLIAQKPNSAPGRSFSYTFILTDGTNASAVAWNSQRQLYAAVIAGNEEFPLEIFDAEGNPVSQSSAGFDWRGLWYNPANDRFEGNGAGDFGWASFSLNGDNQPSDVNIFKNGQFQPDFQTVGCYDDAKKQVVYIDYGVDGIAMHSRKNPKKVKQLSLDWSSSDIGDMNTTSIGYTGHKDYEFVLLNITDGKLVFFNRKGEQTATSKLPADAPLNEAFTFSFANNHAFLYDIDGRTWHAYKVW